MNAGNRRWARRGLLAVLGPALFGLGMETVLRLGGAGPTGRFAFAYPGESGLYPPNASIDMSWAGIHYTVKSNSRGFRGPEFSAEKPAGRLRIVAVGDSVTDGFFVDNDATYPALLQRALDASRPGRTEVINAAHGGGSIDKQLWILRELVLPLKPDAVVLMFVTNDISDIRGRSREQLLSWTPESARGVSSFERWLVTRTAFGETLKHAYLLVKSGKYRQARERLRTGKDRYAVPGGADFEANLGRFREHCRRTDGMVLDEPFSAAAAALVENYLFGLDRFAAACREAGARLILAYFPAYSQVYESSPSMKIRNMLRDACRERGGWFCDLTATFRERGRHEVLHLAPLDFHPNPAGNRLIAATLAEFLTRTSLEPERE